MKMYCKTRSQARSFNKSGKVIDNGVKSPVGRRWSVDVPIKRK